MLLQTSAGAAQKETRKPWSHVRSDPSRILRIPGLTRARIIRKIQKQVYVHELGEIPECLSRMEVALIVGIAVVGRFDYKIMVGVSTRSKSGLKTPLSGDPAKEKPFSVVTL